MEYYIFNNQTLSYEPYKSSKIMLIASITVGLALTAFVNDPIVKLYENEVVVVLDKSIFTNERLFVKLKETSIKFPHIVYAQAILETGNFKSKVFLENNNLFGMKAASKRPSTAISFKNEYAVYEDWQASVIDYALFQAAYLKHIKTETEYFEYLEASYAEDKDYVIKIKSIIKTKQNGNKN
jgi:hypothetical protein